MSGRARPFLQSLAVHAAMVGLVFLLSGLAGMDSAPVVIDFSLEEARAPAKVAHSVPAPPAGKREEPPRAAVPPPVPEPPPPPEPIPEEEPEVEPEPVPEPDAVPLPDAALSPPPQPSEETYSSAAPDEDAGPPAPEVRPSLDAEADVAPEGGGAVSEEAAREGYLKANFAYIRDLIHRGIAYPPLARRMGWEGRVKVSFIVSRDGSVRDVKVVESSGRDTLDRDAADTVVKASPFPPPPVEAKVVLPIVYRLY